MKATQRENETGLVAYYRFDEGKGTLTADATANHFNAALTGTFVWAPSSAPVNTVNVLPGVPRTFRLAGTTISASRLLLPSPPCRVPEP